MSSASTDAAQAAAGDTPRALHTERTAPRYARTIVLPAELDAGAAQARMENGVLTLTLPKRIASGASEGHGAVARIGGAPPTSASGQRGRTSNA